MLNTYMEITIWRYTVETYRQIFLNTMMYTQFLLLILSKSSYKFYF